MRFVYQSKNKELHSERNHEKIPILLISLTIFISCKDSVSNVETFALIGTVKSEYDWTLISNAEIFLNDSVVDTTDQLGNFLITGLTNGQYKLEVKPVLNHRALVVKDLVITSSDINSVYYLPFRYNLVEEIISDLNTKRATNLIGRFTTNGRTPTALNDSSIIKLKFEKFIFSTDTLEFSFITLIDLLSLLETIFMNMELS